MDKYTENRFGYLKELDDESLIIKKEEILSEIEYLMTVLNNENTSPEEKSEIRNSDLKYERDRLEYINHLILDRKTRNSENIIKM